MKNLMFGLIHNVVAHPIIGVTSVAHVLASKFHDWTSRCAWPR